MQSTFVNVCNCDVNCNVLDPADTLDSSLFVLKFAVFKLVYIGRRALGTIYREILVPADTNRENNVLEMLYILCFYHAIDLNTLLVIS